MGVVSWVDTVRVDVPLPPEVRVTLVGLTETVGPFGETDGDSVIVPTKAPRLVRVIVEVPDVPGEIESEDGLDEIEKSTTLAEIEAEWDSEPSVAVTEIE
jgi:hypothetical protein